MSGQRMVDQMNSNWNATDAQFLAHQNQLNIIQQKAKEFSGVFDGFKSMFGLSDIDGMRAP